MQNKWKLYTKARNGLLFHWKIDLTCPNEYRVQ